MEVKRFYATDNCYKVVNNKDELMGLFFGDTIKQAYYYNFNLIFIKI